MLSPFRSPRYIAAAAINEVEFDAELGMLEHPPVSGDDTLLDDDDDDGGDDDDEDAILASASTMHNAPQRRRKKKTLAETLVVRVEDYLGGVAAAFGHHVPESDDWT